MATRTSHVASIESPAGIVFLEYDWDDTGLVTQIDEEGELADLIEDQPLVAIRIVNTMTSGTVRVHVRPGIGRGRGKILSFPISQGTLLLDKAPGVRDVKHMTWFGLGVEY